MTRIIQHLWFEKDMEAALRLYTSNIPGSSLDWMTTMPAESPSGPPGSVIVAGFTLGGQTYQAIQAAPIKTFTHSFSIMVECDDQAEVDRLWEVLGDGGEIEQCGWLRDRWGLYWQIVPKRLGELMGDPDPAVVKRVAEAMLTMVKLDVAGLEAAARG